MSKTTSSFIEEWANGQKSRGSSVKGSSVFYRNLEAELDTSRAQHSFVALHNQMSNLVDFTSCDVLGIGQSGAIREAFLEEFSQHPQLPVGAHGARLLDGTQSTLRRLRMRSLLFTVRNCPDSHSSAMPMMSSSKHTAS
ncbi:conserved hypothetical protein [Histoplasma capsulatum var. duboisii H88]|uniref:Uncharacterized protein n=1 Tax=Ajellomyces capsulatus (strain H88) TaxID=544711 RepID=F0UDR0_AJEC8|nr:conserved hypothetical protein [Histoplasma capsulatum var. duboisii H88]